MERIIRSLGDVNINEESRTVHGYALLFNVRSQFIGWYETISPTALTQDVIDNSDVFALFNHDDSKVLARSEMGNGTLKLEIDEKGLKYTFDAPRTALGDELLEYLKRGDIHQSSFAFGIDFTDDEMVTKEYRDGAVYYTINRIPVLYDVSPVWTPAYAETFVGKRAKEIADDIIKRAMPQNNIDDDMKEEEIKDEEIKEENIPDEEERQDDNEEETTDENQEESTDEDAEKEEEQMERSTNKNHNNITMKEQKFSLIKAIRAIANNQTLDDVSRAVIDAGCEQMRNSGLTIGGQIQLPTGDVNQRSLNVTSVHEDLIVTEFANLLEPLRANNVAVQLGCKYYDNLVGDLQVPIMGAQNVGWAGEIEDAPSSNPSFSHVLLQPHRLTAYIDVTKEFLAQDSLSVEDAIRRDLVAAINTKLEQTMFSANASTATRPAGLFYNMVATTCDAFDDVCGLEATLESANFYGGYKYILSPTAKAFLRSTIKGTNATGMIMENNEIDGTPAFVTTNMITNDFAVGDWSNVAIANWGGIDLTVDPYSLARSGQVRITINTYFDFKLLRDNAIALGAIS